MVPSTSHPRERLTSKSYEKEVQHHLEADNMKRVHMELNKISIMLQKESEALHKREVQLRERERALRNAEKLSHTTDIIIDKVVTREVENRCQAVIEVKLLWYLIRILSIKEFKVSFMLLLTY